LLIVDLRLLIYDWLSDLLKDEKAGLLRLIAKNAAKQPATICHRKQSDDPVVIVRSAAKQPATSYDSSLQTE
jgi:hypothetical protein